MNTQQIRYMEAISSTCHKQGMKASRLVSRAVELVKAVQKAIMPLPPSVWYSQPWEIMPTVDPLTAYLW